MSQNEGNNSANCQIANTDTALGCEQHLQTWKQESRVFRRHSNYTGIVT